MPRSYVCSNQYLLEAMLMISITGRKATSTIKAVNRMTILVQSDSPLAQMREDINKYKEESARVSLLHILCQL